MGFGVSGLLSKNPNQLSLLVEHVLMLKWRLSRQKYCSCPSSVASVTSCYYLPVGREFSVLCCDSWMLGFMVGVQNMWLSVLCS